MSEAKEFDQAGGRRERLLVIDDDAAMVDLFREIGELDGMEVVGITNPQNLDAVLDPVPDRIILDLFMPDVDGIEVLRELKERNCSAGLILVSGGDKRMLNAAVAMAGLLGLSVLGDLRKPVMPDALRALLRKERTARPAAAPPAYVPTADELRQALAAGQFFVEYQPQVLLTDGKWTGLEALVRWNHPGRGRIGPGGFIAEIERLGLGADLSEYVLAQVAAELPGLRASGFAGAVFVNLPPSALIDVRLTERLMDRIDAAGIAHQDIGFEMTETSLVQDRAVAIDILARLRMKRCWLAIDDFGTGHSTLEMLHDLPFTELKIDIDFVRRLETDQVARSIVKHSIRLGQDLAISVIGEGIESESSYRWLRDAGCNTGQGYFIARPMAAGALADWHREWQQRRPARPELDAGGAGFADFDAVPADAGTGFCVFAVDDEPILRLLLADVLAGECELESFASAQACLDRLPARKPDLLLLDVSMPVMSGIELCRRLKDDFETRDIPVMFISGEESPEARLGAYEAGGVDFIAKPFDRAELVRKVRAARSAFDGRLALREQAGFAQRTAFTAMSSMGELGAVIEFLRKSFACGSVGELAEATLAALGQYGLNCAVQVAAEGSFHTLSPQGENLPLEVSVLTSLRDQGRIFEFKNRGVYNFGHVTILVNNMPLDDPERCGRIRDNLAILAEGADARVDAIELEHANLAKQAGIAGALGSINQTLARLYEGQRQRSFQSVELIDELQDALMKSFVHLGLTTAQEDFLAGLIQGYVERLLDMNRQNDAISVELEGLAQSLRALAGRQEA